jgi:hypothetical protein
MLTRTFPRAYRHHTESARASRVDAEVPADTVRGELREGFLELSLVVEWLPSLSLALLLVRLLLQLFLALPFVEALLRVPAA